MKYYCRLEWKIVALLQVLLLSILSTVFYSDFSFSQKIFIPVGISLFVYFFYIFLNSNITVSSNDVTIEINLGWKRTKQLINLLEITKIRSDYFGIPQIGFLILETSNSLRPGVMLLITIFPLPKKLSF